MQIYARYIVGRILGPLLLIAISLTALVWLAQSLRFLDFIVNRGLDTAMFLYLSSLLIPSLLVIVLPIALFISVTIAYNKLVTESELVVMISSGISKLKLIFPAVFMSLWVCALGYAITMYILPSSYREFKDLQAFIRDNYVSVLLQEGVFNSPTKNLTVYIREINEDGKLYGMLMHDRRTPEKPVTMMAESGKLTKTELGPRFILENGNRQEIDRSGSQISLLYFDRYALDLSAFTSKGNQRWREPEERFLDELFNPQDETPPRLYDKLRAEAHNRIVWPLYSFLLALIAMTPFITGEFNRRGQWQKILYSSIISLVYIGIAIALKNSVAKTPQIIPLLYVVPIASIFGCFYIFLKTPQSQKTLSEERAK